jgi:biotin carboxylase
LFGRVFLTSVFLGLCHKNTGGEAGVDLADALSEHMKIRTNGTNIANRRDKKVQQEIIRKHGLRSVRQAGGDKFSDVEEFLKTETYPVVLKPVESVSIILS